MKVEILFSGMCIVVNGTDDVRVAMIQAPNHQPRLSYRWLDLFDFDAKIPAGLEQFNYVTIDGVRQVGLEFDSEIRFVDTVRAHGEKPIVLTSAVGQVESFGELMALEHQGAERVAIRETDLLGFAKLANGGTAGATDLFSLAEGNSVNRQYPGKRFADDFLYTFDVAGALQILVAGSTLEFPRSPQGLLRLGVSNDPVKVIGGPTPNAPVMGHATNYGKYVSKGTFSIPREASNLVTPPAGRCSGARVDGILVDWS